MTPFAAKGFDMGGVQDLIHELGKRRSNPEGPAARAVRDIMATDHGDEGQRQPREQDDKTSAQSDQVAESHASCLDMQTEYHPPTGILSGSMNARRELVGNIQFPYSVNNGSVPNTPGNALTGYYSSHSTVDVVSVGARKCLG